MMRLAHIIRIPLVYFRVAVLHEMQYRAHLALQLLHTGASVTLALVSLGVVFSHGNQINGWSADGLLVLVGFFLAVNGIIGTAIQPGLKLLMQQVRLGTLDFAVLKPVDTQVVVSFQGLDPWKTIDVIVGLGVIAAGVSRAGVEVSPVAVGQCLVVTAAGLAALYATWVMLASLTFWFVKTGELLDIARCVFDSGRWPVSMYPPAMRHALTFVVPVGLSVTLPARTLTHGIDASTVAIAIGASATMLVLSRIVWATGLRQYSGASA